MNPDEQCLPENEPPIPLPYRKSKRFYPGGMEIPEPPREYDPDCFKIVQGNGNNGSPATPAAINSDSNDGNQIVDPSHQQYNNINGNHLASGIGAHDDGDDILGNTVSGNDDIFKTP